ncbi:MAG: ADP-glyceromanno-heptose 6-epimerase, partial [Caulobacteraceae bacterium]
MSGGLVLLTGGAGFIGSNILAELSGGAAFEVAVCDRLGAAAEGKWRNLMGCFPVDLIAPEALWPWLARCGEEVETIIHMGAISSTTETDLDLLMETNFVLSRDLFDWCAEKRRRFIWASSAATYGDGKAGFEDGSEPNWLATLRPLNPYGWSKALFDLYAARRAARGHAPPQWAGLKFFNVYGPREGHKGEMASVAAKVWPDVAAGRPVRLFRSAHPDYDDGGQMRDFLFVGDAVRVVRWLLEHPETRGIFNVGTGKARSFAD